MPWVSSLARIRLRRILVVVIVPKVKPGPEKSITIQLTK